MYRSKRKIRGNYKQKITIGLWKQSANQSSVGHAPHSQDVSRRARINVEFAHGFMHIVKSAPHDELQFGIHFLHLPEKSLQVLRPFKIADGDSAGVGQNVRNYENALARKN